MFSGSHRKADNAPAPHLQARTSISRIIPTIPCVYDERDRWELEANVFAAELLAPIEHIRLKVRADPAWTVTGLAAYFGISRAALRNQLALALLPGPLEDREPDCGPVESAQPFLPAYRIRIRMRRWQPRPRPSYWPDRRVFG